MQLHYDLQTVAATELESIEKAAQVRIVQKFRQSCPSRVSLPVYRLQFYVQINAQSAPLRRLCQASDEANGGVARVREHRRLPRCQSGAGQRHCQERTPALCERNENGYGQADPDGPRVQARRQQDTYDQSQEWQSHQHTRQLRRAGLLYLKQTDYLDVIRVGKLIDQREAA